MGTVIGDYIGTTRDPFPHSLLSTRQYKALILLEPQCPKPKTNRDEAPKKLICSPGHVIVPGSRPGAQDPGDPPEPGFLLTNST